jgi:hypothetical protein
VTRIAKKKTSCPSSNGSDSFALLMEYGFFVCSGE